MGIYSIWQEKVEHPEYWLTRADLKEFLGLKSSNKFDAYIKEIEALDDSYKYVFGTNRVNKTFHKIRVIEYINAVEREKYRKKARG